MRSGWQSRREGPATQRNEALFESFLQRRDLWPPGGTQPILISDFTTPSVPFRIQRAPCCVVLHLLSLRWSLRSSAHPRSPRHKKTTDFNFRGRHITIPLHIPQTPFSLVRSALFVSDSKGVLLCCVASSLPPVVCALEGTERWTEPLCTNASRDPFEPFTTNSLLPSASFVVPMGFFKPETYQTPSHFDPTTQHLDRLVALLVPPWRSCRRPSQKTSKTQAICTP